MDPPPEARSLIDKFREAHRPGQRPKPDAEPSNWIGDQPSFSRLGQDLFGGVAQKYFGFLRPHTAYGPAYVGHKLAPIEDKTVPLINLPSAFSRERREACMARIAEAPIR